MLRTALLCIVLALGGYASAAWLTHGFQAWTAEGARRLEVALQPVPAPPVRVDGPGVPDQALATLLADGNTVTIIDFVYTRCRTVCLALGTVFQQLQLALQAEPAGGRVRLLSISFDPGTDDPAALGKYAARMNADPSLWRFVRVADAAATRRLLDAFQVVVVPDGRGDYEHNAALLVVDQQGRLVRVFDYSDLQLALDYARSLASPASP
jgi:protein SCO1/2